MKSWFVSLFDWAGDRGRKASSCRGGGGIVGRPIRRGCIELSRLPDREVVAKPLLWQTGSVKRSLPPADSIGSWYIPKIWAPRIRLAMPRRERAAPPQAAAGAAPFRELRQSGHVKGAR